jgi:hypothetical protein
VGIADAAIFDLRKGVINGAAGNLIIDESLLPQISFIREGEFNETKGKPTLKLIGSVESVGNPVLSGTGKPYAIKTQGIRTPDIVLGFLKGTKTSDPISYFTQICYESSAYLPFYYYLKQANLSISDAKALVEKQYSTTQAKTMLLARLNSDDKLAGKMPSAKNPSGQRKIATRGKLISGGIQNCTDSQELSDVLDLIMTLSRTEMALVDLRKILLGIFNTHFAKQMFSLNMKIRRAICYVDWLHNGGHT